MNLQDYFQVCTFKASASAIHHGTGHSPQRQGAGPLATLPSTRRATRCRASPATLAAKGWVKVGRYRISSSGKFVTGLLHPTRTTTYVAKYTGDYFPAFTSVVKVTVR